jgi:hypothetical protein
MSMQQIQTAILVDPAQTGTPQPVPLVVNRVNYASVNPAVLHLQNPPFQPPGSLGQIDTSFNLPTLISPSTAATPDMLLCAPCDPAKRFFLTHYGIAIAPGAGPQAQWVSLQSTVAAYRLTVHLADTTPTALSTGNTRITPGAVRHLLTASPRGRAVNWDLTPAASPFGAALTLVLEPNDFASRDLLYAAMTDPVSQARLIARNQLDLALPSSPPPQAFMRATVGVDVAIPFVFSKDLDSNVFEGLHDASGTLPPWNACAVNWNGRRNTYYQADNQPTQVYFLPDAFKIGRQTTLPRRPSLSVTANSAYVASMQMTLSYLAAPVWDLRRIAGVLEQRQARRMSEREHLLQLRSCGSGRGAGRGAQTRTQRQGFGCAGRVRERADCHVRRDPDSRPGRLPQPGRATGHPLGGVHHRRRHRGRPHQEERLGHRHPRYAVHRVGLT